MINRGVDMQNPGNGYSAFVAAVAKGRVGIVFSMICAGANVDDASANGTPLIMAVEQGNESIVRLLIAQRSKCQHFTS